MVEDVGISPKEILVFTFSKKAALEMSQRFERSIAGKYYPVYFGTFHAVFYNIIKTHYGFGKESVLSDKQKKMYIKRIISKHANTGFEISDIDEILSFISLIKNNDSDSDINDVISKAFESTDKQQGIQIIYSEYCEYCKKDKKLDFDDMINMCQKLFETNKEILNQYCSVYKYILVDEFQDINSIQYDVLCMLAGDNKNVFCVGDDDQSIYGFRGSKPELMQRFIDEFDNCNVIDMNKNYRSASCIVDTAGKFIAANKNRISKFQVPCKLNKESGNIILKISQNAINEADYVCEEIEKIANTNNLSDVCILFRSLASANILMEKMNILGIPFVRGEYEDNFYESEWVKDIIAYLKVATGNNDINLVSRIINRPERGLSKDIILDYGSLHKVEKPTYIKFSNQLSAISNMSAYAATKYVLKAMGYETYFISKMLSKGYKEDDIRGQIDELLLRSKSFSNIKEWLLQIDILKEKYDNSNNRVTSVIQNHYDGKINMMTAHASKGLEFETVFIIGLQEGIFPHRKAITEAEIEEERRLLYVAMTRAKTNLYIIGRGEEKHGKKVSVFVKELEKICI